MPSENNKRIARNTLFLYFRMLFAMGVSLYTSRVVLETLGIVDFGIYNVIGGVVSMFSFLNTSMANGVQRFLNIKLGIKDDKGLNAVFNTSIIIHISLIIIIILLAETVGLWFLHNKMTIPAERLYATNWVYQLSIIAFAIIIFRVPFNALIIAHEEMNIYAYFSIIDIILKLSIVFLLRIVNNDRLILYAILMAIVCLIDCFIYILYCNHKYKIRIKIEFSKETFAEMIGFSGWNIFGSLAHLMKNQGVNVLLNMFFSPSVNAARSLAYQVLAALSSFSSNIMLASRPQMIKSYAQNDIKYLMKLVYTVSKFSFFLLFFLSLPILIEINQVLHLWLGKNIPDYTAIFTRLIILITLVEVFASPLTTVVHATGNMKKFQLICSSIILMIIPISYLFLKLGFSPESPFIVSLVICILVHIVRVYLLKQLIPFSGWGYFSEVIIPGIKVSVLSSILPLLLHYNMDSHTYRFVLTFIICILSTGVIIFYVGLKKNEQVRISAKLRNAYSMLIK